MRHYCKCCNDLKAISCDFCDAEIHPNQGVSESGWTKHGVKAGCDDWEWDCCPEHEDRGEASVRCMAKSYATKGADK